MRNELQRMRNQGMSFEDIENMLADMKAEEAAKAARVKAEVEKAKADREKEARVAPAREELVEAITNYMFALGVIDKEDIEKMDPNEFIEALKEIEVTIDAMMKLEAMKAARHLRLPKTNHATFGGDTELNMPLLRGLALPNPSMGVLRVTSEDEDGDIIKKFLSDMEKRG